MIAGVLISSVVIGQVISRTGKWKRYMVTGSILLTIGLALMGTIRYDTSFLLVFVYMFVMGAGVGMVMQNLVLIVQNAVDPRQIGTASASVAFFRSLGGTIGVSAMGAVLGGRIKDLVLDGLRGLGVDPSQAGGIGSGTIPDLSTLPAPFRTLIESAYGEAVGDVFLLAAPLAVISIVAIALLPNLPLSRQTSQEKLAAQERDTVVAVSAAEIAADTRGIDLAAETSEASDAPDSASGATAPGSGEGGSRPRR